MQIRKDYGRQFGALIASTINAGFWWWLLDGASIWLILIIWLVGYAAGYQGLIEWAAKTKLADTNKL